VIDGARRSTVRPNRLPTFIGVLAGAAWGAALAAILAVAAVAADADPLANAVFERIAERLALMKPVAAWKWEHGVAVEDRAREAIVIESATEQAAKVGLAVETARPFFEAQIAAAKEIQRCWIARWDAGASPPRQPPDLRAELRPKLLEIAAALLTDVRAALTGGVAFDETRIAAFAAATDLDCLSVAARDAVYRQLSGLRLAE
jgi:chorismate mutase-like protein